MGSGLLGGQHKTGKALAPWEGRPQAPGHPGGFPSVEECPDSGVAPPSPGRRWYVWGLALWGLGCGRGIHGATRSPALSSCTQSVAMGAMRPRVGLREGQGVPDRWGVTRGETKGLDVGVPWVCTLVSQHLWCVGLTHSTTTVVKGFLGGGGCPVSLNLILWDALLLS